MNLNKLPKTPGVYLLKKGSEIVYVGKAMNLRARVKTHLFTKIPLSPKAAKMRSEVDNFDFTPVRSDFEALILEINLIKKHSPIYNIKLKDAKDYLYLKLTAENFPRVLAVRQRDLIDSLYYLGPFPNSSLLRSTLKSLRRIFPFCAEKKKTGQPCFYYHLGLCPGPCAGLVTKKDYKKTITNLISFLNGNCDKVLLGLQKEMEKLSKEQKYEQAAEVRDKFVGINYLLNENRVTDYLENPDLLEDLMVEEMVELQKIVRTKRKIHRIECYDISHLSGTNMVGSLVVFTDGQPERDQYRRFRIKTIKQIDDFAALQEVLTRRFHNDWQLPDLIVIDGGKGQLSSCIEVLVKLGIDIPIISLAKRDEEIYTQDGQKLRLQRSNPALKLIQRLRDEAHRFAITYHRKLRSLALLYPNP